MRFRRLLPHLVLGLVALIYGFNYFIAKDIFTEIRPLGVVAVRSFFAVLFFSAIQVFVLRERIQSRKDYLRLFLCAMLGISLNQIFFFSGLDRTYEINASVLMTTTPVFVVLVGFFMRVERMNGPKLFGLLLSFAGAVLLSIGGRSLQFNTDTIIGDLMVTFNAAVYGLYLVVVRPLLQRYKPLTVMTWIFAFGALVNIPLGIPDLLQVDYVHLSQPALWGIVYIVTFVTIGAYSLNAIALKRVPSSTAGIYIYLQPVLVTVLAFFLLERGVSLEQLAYICMVLLGVYLVSYEKRTN